MTRRFPPATLAGFESTKHLYIHGGDHRFIQIWVVVVDGRVIVRSWNDKTHGWYRAFLSHPNGAVRIGDGDVPVRAVRLRSSRLNDAADHAYASKYTTKPTENTLRGSGCRDAKRPRWSCCRLNNRPGTRRRLRSPRVPERERCA